MTEVKENVRSIIAEILEVEEQEVGDEVQFTKDLGADSLKALELLAALEKEYKIHIDESNLSKLTSLNSTIGVLDKIMN